MSRILIVDDERPLLRALGAHLEARGYEVDLVEPARPRSLARATSVHDAAIVDLGLPGIDGIEVVHGLRGWTVDPDHRALRPAPGLAEDHGARRRRRRLRHEAVQHGRAPRAAARRVAASEARRRGLPIVETADFRIDLATKRATNAAGAEIKLTPTQWHLVEILVRNPDRLVSQRQLLEEVWGPSYVNQTNYLRQFMAQLRHKFEPDPAHPRYFLTEPGMGIRFDPPAETEIA